MSLAKAAFSGTVYKEPQKRFTSNNVPITYFTFNIGTDEEELIRVRALGNLAERVEKEIFKNDKLVVAGSLTIPTIKTETGADKRIVELGLSSFEKITGTGTAANNTVPAQAAPVNEQQPDESIVTFSEPDNDLIGETEIPF